MDIDGMTYEIQKLNERVATLQASLVLQTRLLPNTFFRYWYATFLVILIAIAVCAAVVAVNTAQATRDVGFIADVMEHPDSEVIIE